MKSDCSLIKKLSKYVIRSTLSTVGNSIYVLADSFFVAQSIGVLGVAVMNLAMPLFNIMDGLGLLLGMGGGTLFTIYKSHNLQKAQRIYSKALILGIIIGLLFSLCGIFLSSQISYALGANSDTFNHTHEYVHIILLFGPTFILNNLLLSFSRNDHGTKIAMIAMIMSSLANIFLDWFLIIKLNLGMKGAGLATSLAPIISLLIITKHFMSPHNKLKIVKFKTQVKELIHITSLGLPSFLTEMSTGVGIFIYNWVFLKINGNNAVTAYGIAANVLLVALSLFTGVAQGIQPIVSQAYANKNFKNIKFGLRFGLIVSEIIGLCCLVFVYFKSNMIIDFFNAASNKTVITLTTEGMKMLLLSLIFSSLNVVFNIFFSAINKSHTSIFMVVIRGYLLPILIVLIMSRLGTNGVWLSLTIIEFIAFILELFAWSFIRKRLEQNDFTI